MRAEWARIGPEVQRKIDPELDEDEQSAMVVRRYELMRGFWDQHSAAVMALNPGMQRPDLAAVEAHMGKVAELEAKLQKAREDLLQKTADLAEARQVVEEGLLARLAGLEALAPEQWAAMEMEPSGGGTGRRSRASAKNHFRLSTRDCRATAALPMAGAALARQSSAACGLISHSLLAWEGAQTRP